METAGDGVGVLLEIVVDTPPQPTNPPASTSPNVNGAMELPNESLIFFPSTGP
jgi:hypothetical protein